jgi:predicted N-acetyltransferase YhbS
MPTEIRHVRAEEFEDFMRYVERAFGHSKAFFERAYPHLYQPTETALEWAYIVDENGKIVSHVGLYPIETVTAGVPLSIGGIGAVSTTPAARGKGYMTQLLNHVIDEMRRIGYPVSWLGGDRQRYNTFGWELASPVYRLDFSQRSLRWHNVDPVAVQEVLPEEAIEALRRYQTLPACHTTRPNLARQMQKMDLRFWVAEDGYAILGGQGRGHIHILELVSASGREAGMIRAMLEWNFGDRASWELSMWDETRLARLLPVTSYWSGSSTTMYRINDLAQLLLGAQDFLNTRAAALRDFDVTLRIKERDRTTATTLTVENGTVHIEPGGAASSSVELDPVEAARLLLGGPSTQMQPTLPLGLAALLPVPAYVLPFDHV